MHIVVNVRLLRCAFTEISLLLKYSAHMLSSWKKFYLMDAHIFKTYLQIQFVSKINFHPIMYKIYTSANKKKSNDNINVHSLCGTPIRPS